MSLDNFKNFAKSTLASGITNAATSLTVATGDGAKFPAASFNATIWNKTDYADPSDDPNHEIVRVTAIATDTFTITRAQEGTTAQNLNVAGKTYGIIATLTAKTLTTDLNPLGVTNGGTGTQTQFTQGSVPFAGANGVYNQNNGQLFWDNTNNRLGVGTASPAYPIDANGHLRSLVYLLGTGPDLSLIPVVGGQSYISSWWGLVLAGNKQSSLDYTPTNIGGAGDATVIVANQQAGKIGLIVYGQTGQTGNLQEWRASGASTPLSYITSAGGLTLATPLAVGSGGTGASTLTANNVLLGNGTSAVQTVAPGTSGNVLTSNGTTWQSSTPAAGGEWTLVTSGSTTSSSVTISSALSLNTDEMYKLVIMADLPTNGNVYLTCNNDTTSGDYVSEFIAWYNSTSTQGNIGSSATSLKIGYSGTYLTAGTLTTLIEIQITRYSTHFVLIKFEETGAYNGAISTASGNLFTKGSGTYFSNSDVTRLDIVGMPASGTTCRYWLYKIAKTV